MKKTKNFLTTDIKQKIRLGGEKSKHISNESQQIINKTNKQIECWINFSTSFLLFFFRILAKLKNVMLYILHTRRMVLDDSQLKGEMPKSLVTIEKAADYLEQAGGK